MKSVDFLGRNADGAFHSNKKRATNSLANGLSGRAMLILR